MIFIPFIPIFLFLILCACIGIGNSSNSRRNTGYRNDYMNNYSSYGMEDNNFGNGYENNYSSYGREESFRRTNQRQNPISTPSVPVSTPTKASNNVNKRLNPQLYEREKSGINSNRTPLQSTMSEREYIQSQRQDRYMNEPPRVQTNYEKRLAQERQAKEQNRNIPSIYQQNRSDNNRQTGYQPGPKGQVSTSNRYSQQNNNNNSRPNTDITNLKGKPGLMEILNQNRKNK